jgi:hypothetical protein
MNTQEIDKAFEKMINERGVHRRLGISSANVRGMRNKISNGIAVSTGTKLKLLQKAGIRQEDRTFTRKDLVFILKFYINTSAAARDLGPEYVVDKYLFSRK